MSQLKKKKKNLKQQKPHTMFVFENRHRKLDPIRPNVEPAGNFHKCNKYQHSNLKMSRDCMCKSGCYIIEEFYIFGVL